MTFHLYTFIIVNNDTFEGLPMLKENPSGRIWNRNDKET